MLPQPARIVGDYWPIMVSEYGIKELYTSLEQPVFSLFTKYS